MRLICLGYGYSARDFIRCHGTRFSAIAATAREAATATQIIDAGLQPVMLGADNLALQQALRASDCILVSAGPDAGGDPFLPRVRAALDGVARGKKVLYLSTVGVYGDHGGDWVTEQTPPRPVSQRSIWRLAAEESWLAFGRDSGAAVQIFRLGGIYGPGQSAIEALKAGTAKRLIKPGQVFNRIHVRDIGVVLAAALDRGTAGAIWNVTDDEPAPPQDVVSYAARLLGMTPPPETDFATAVLSPMARSFYGENKRVSNAAIRHTLQAALLYPTYREGIAALAASSP